MICTEQERAAMIAVVIELGTSSVHYGMAFKSGDLIQAGIWSKDADDRLAEIRAMLAPDDAVVRERIAATLVERSMAHPKMADEIAETVLAVLQRGEATRDE